MASLEYRLKENRLITPEGHWIWLGVLTSEGYGQISVNNHSNKVHRISYLVFTGVDPGAMCVLHKPTCNRRDCFNPEHLYLGTAKENANDQKIAGTNPHLKRTHCPHGHPYSGDNLYMRKTPGGTGRMCRTCYIERRRLSRCR